MIDIFYIIFLFILGLYLGSFFTKIGNRLVKKEELFFSKSKCTNCSHELGIIDTTPILSYIINKGKCKYCKEKISIIYPVFEIFTAILFVLCYLIFKDKYPELLNIIFSCLFISSLLIIMLCDIKYMIIPNEILILFSIILIPLKIYITYKLDTSLTFMDLGYEILFMLLDGLIMFAIMYVIRLIGNLIFKEDTMGGGDIKMMFYVSMIVGYKLSIVIVFVSSFISLPLSIINMHTKKTNLLAFAPYLALSTMIIYLTQIDFNTIIEYIVH